MSAPRPDPDAQLAEAAERFGTPAYVYFADRIADRIERLTTDFGRWFSLSFAVKSNPNAALLAWLAPRIAHLDVSSGGNSRVVWRQGGSGPRQLHRPGQARGRT